MARLGSPRQFHARKKPAKASDKSLRFKRRRPVQSEASAARAQRGGNRPRPGRRR